MLNTIKENTSSNDYLTSATTVDFFLNDHHCHPNVTVGRVSYYGSKDRNVKKFPAYTDLSFQIADAHTTQSSTIELWVGEKPCMLRPMLQPEGRIATFVFSEHPDGSSVESIKAVYFGTSDSSSPDYMKKGFVGHGIQTTRGEWLYGATAKNGFTLYVIDEISGDILKTRKFEPYPHPEDFQKMVECIHEIPEGRYVAIAFNDVIKPPPQEWYEAIESLGSSTIRNLCAFDSWILLGKKGARCGSVPEKLVKKGKGSASLVVKLEKPPVKVLILGSSKYDDATAVIDVFREGKLIHCNDDQGLNTGILTCSCKKEVIDTLFQNGIEIVPHTISPQTDYCKLKPGFKVFDRLYNPKVWIDHGYNFEDLVCLGWDSKSVHCILDDLERYDYRYAWNWWDMGYYVSEEFGKSFFPFNMLYPDDDSRLPLLFYSNNNIDLDRRDPYTLFFFNAHPLTYFPDTRECYTLSMIDDLISERGVHIDHNYFAHALKFVEKKGNHFEIWPPFDAFLSYMRQKVDEGILWNPTVSEFGDYFRQLQNVDLNYRNRYYVEVVNNNATAIRGLAFSYTGGIAHHVTVDNLPLTNYRRVGSDLVFWLDISGKSSREIRIAHEAAPERNTEYPLVENLSEGTLINTDFYGALVNNKGELYIAAIDYITLLGTVKTFRGIYDTHEFEGTGSVISRECTVDDARIKVSLKWEDPGIDLSLHYIFYKNNHIVRLIIERHYKGQMKIDHEKITMRIPLNTLSVLNHRSQWSCNRKTPYVYGASFPCYASFGTGQKALHIVKDNKIDKTVVAGY